MQNSLPPQAVAATNICEEVVRGFGDEWQRFDQSKLSVTELSAMFDSYFNIFPWAKLPPNAIGFDLGCGSGRWAKFVAPRVGFLHLIDPSAEALAVARVNLGTASNCQFHQASVDTIPLDDNSTDFGYSLGVLHHIPDTEAGLRQCVAKLKPGAPFLLYLYYAFDNRPLWFRLIWKVSDLARRIISQLPFNPRFIISDILARLIYWPLTRIALALEMLGGNVENFPLSWYRHRTLYVMRNDALDRFGTRLEQRFTQAQVKQMMLRAGLCDITFNNDQFWTAVGYKSNL
jgi:ubiquinone/menaquinone biosynthesis C-methylase UbiE